MLKIPFWKLVILWLNRLAGSCVHRRSDARARHHQGGGHAIHGEDNFIGLLEGGCIGQSYLQGDIAWVPGIEIRQGGFLGNFHLHFFSGCQGCRFVDGQVLLSR